jgi:hypothetical protein
MFLFSQPLLKISIKKNDASREKRPVFTLIRVSILCRFRNFLRLFYRKKKLKCAKSYRITKK